MADNERMAPEVPALLSPGGNGVPPSSQDETNGVGGRRAVGADAENEGGIAPACAQRPSRKRPAHMPPLAFGNRATIIYLTVCTSDRKAILARTNAHELLRQAWVEAKRWVVGRYAIMPDHIHLFCAPAVYPPPESIRKWMKYWKTLVSRQWPHPDEQPIWQQDGWDTQLRHGESYAAKWEYVRNNPVRAGLVASPEAWPYQGELSALRWHDP